MPLNSQLTLLQHYARPVCALFSGSKAAFCFYDIYEIAIFTRNFINCALTFEWISSIFIRALQAPHEIKILC